MRTTVRAERFHDFSYGHRVTNHESKCAFLHGHNGRVHFTCEAAELDAVGRVIDFSAIKERLCEWVENNWDHKFLAWEEDEAMLALANNKDVGATMTISRSIVWVPFNPTAENMAKYLLETIGPAQLADTGVTLIKVRVDETRKCSATAVLRSN